MGRLVRLQDSKRTNKLLTIQDKLTRFTLWPLYGPPQKNFLDGLELSPPDERIGLLATRQAPQPGRFVERLANTPADARAEVRPLLGERDRRAQRESRRCRLSGCDRSTAGRRVRSQARFSTASSNRRSTAGGRTRVHQQRLVGRADHHPLETIGAGKGTSEGPSTTGQPARHRIRSISMTRRVLRSCPGPSRGCRRSTA